MNKEITVESLIQNFGDNVNQAIKHLEQLLPPIPSRSVKPVLNKNLFLTSDQVLEFSKKLKAYEEATVKDHEALNEFKKGRFEMDNILTSYIKEVSGLNDIPEQYREKVYSLAYSNGHSEGFTGIYNNLVELVEIFN